MLKEQAQSFSLPQCLQMRLIGLLIRQTQRILTLLLGLIGAPCGARPALRQFSSTSAAAGMKTVAQAGPVCFHSVVSEVSTSRENPDGVAFRLPVENIRHMLTTNDEGPFQTKRRRSKQSGTALVLEERHHK